MLTQRRGETAAQGNGDSTVCGEGRAPCHTAKRKSGGRRAAESKVWAERDLGRSRRGTAARFTHAQPGGPMAHFGQQGAGQPVHHPSELRAPGALRSSADQPGCAPCLAPGDCGRRRSSEPRVLWASVMPLIHGGTLRASPRLPVPRFPQCEKGEWRLLHFLDQ